jgi:allantoinase
MKYNYPRDMIGYGANPPDPKWPNGARLAISFVLNFEEGGEYNILNGDAHSENYLCEIVGLPQLEGRRNFFVDSIFEYGSRAGAWRILRIFQEMNLNFTVYGIGLALERNPEAARALAEAGNEIASHAYRWIDYSDMSEEDERKDISLAIAAIEKTTGHRPVGWYTGRFSPNTRRLVVEEGGFLYDSDAYNDDLPYWVVVEGKPHLIIPYSIEANDAKFSLSPGWTSGADFYEYLKATFDFLYREGERTPKLMNIGLHGRFTGRPGRAEGLRRFLDYVRNHDKVWICRRVDIARHWIKYHPFTG